MFSNLLLFSFSAIATVVTVAEILKNNGLAVEKSKILTSSPSLVWEGYSHSSHYNQLYREGLKKKEFDAEL